jgi:hypothetical protein
MKINFEAIKHGLFLYSIRNIKFQCYYFWNGVLIHKNIKSICLHFYIFKQ